VMYTSGTTGRPKGARLTNDGLLSMLSPAALQPTGLPFTVRTALTALPVAHIMGLSSSVGLMLGGITNRIFGRFDPGKVLDVIERERVEMFVGVPAMYRAMLDAGAEDRDLTGVKVWASAADVMPRELAKRFQKMGRVAGPVHSVFVEAYGMVELAGAAMAKVVPPGLPLPKNFAGMPVFPYRVKVVDARGSELPRGKVGELCVRGPGVLEGYHRDADATDKVLDGGWLRTGDLARIGPLGTVFFEGRKKDVIKVGGYSVYPVEVEEEIRKHPKIADAAVLGIDDERKGTVPAAAVVPKRGAKLTTAELERWAKEEIASYRRPRMWRVVKEFPRGSTRKVDKKALAKEFAS
jgi:long-chain acyl-CoA synthetase